MKGHTAFHSYHWEEGLATEAAMHSAGVSLIWSVSASMHTHSHTHALPPPCTHITDYIYFVGFMGFITVKKTAWFDTKSYLKEQNQSHKKKKKTNVCMYHFYSGDQFYYFWNDYKTSVKHVER